MVERFELGEFANRPCGTLSTGQRQRVSVARALLNDPDAVVLDEPTTGLDLVSSQFIHDALRECAKEGRAVLFSTHILSDAELLCDRISIMAGGRIVAEGSVPELLARTGVAQLSRAFLTLVRGISDSEPAP